MQRGPPHACAARRAPTPALRPPLAARQPSPVIAASLCIQLAPAPFRSSATKRDLLRGPGQPAAVEKRPACIHENDSRSSKLFTKCMLPAAVVTDVGSFESAHTPVPSTAPRLEVRHLGLHVRLLLPHRSLLAEHGTAAATSCCSCDLLVLFLAPHMQACSHSGSPQHMSSCYNSNEYPGPARWLALGPGALLVIQACRRGAGFEGRLRQRRRVGRQRGAPGLRRLALRPDVVARRPELRLGDRCSKGRRKQPFEPVSAARAGGPGARCAAVPRQRSGSGYIKYGMQQVVSNVSCEQ